MLSLVTNIPFVTQLSDVSLLSGKLAKSAPNHHGDTVGMPGLFEKDEVEVQPRVTSPKVPGLRGL